MHTPPLFPKTASQIQPSKLDTLPPKILAGQRLHLASFSWLKALEAHPRGPGGGAHAGPVRLTPARGGFKRLPGQQVL